MSTFWSVYITVLALGNIAACWWLLRWSSKSNPNAEEAKKTTGHVWDGDLREYNNPLPNWWLKLFYATVIFGVVYLLLYPGLGKFKGLLGWTEIKQYNQQMAYAQQKYGKVFANYAKKSIVQLAHDPDALQTGQRLFANNCAVCHGSDARGAPGFPNLTDNDWLHGGKPEQIYQTILNGRQGVMPAWGKVLGKQGVAQVAAYVYSLNGRSAPADLVRAGKARFAQLCIACHGVNGKGNQMIGAPNLTDHIWLYGGSMKTIEQTITYGRKNRMPAHKDLLGADEVKVLAAYVYSLSHKQGSSNE